MKQYLDLLHEIKEKGTIKPPARIGMPPTQSLFGAQYRCNLQEGFPLLTTKEINFNHIVTELLWFLRGDTNIKFLVDNGCNIWNEDAYNYYIKKCKEVKIESYTNFESFIKNIKEEINPSKFMNNQLKEIGYLYGDCGWQYGRLWRKWEVEKYTNFDGDIFTKQIDQISELINGLKNNPESRRHMLTALNPAHYNDLALFPCHVLAQFNCRPLNVTQRIEQIQDADARLTCYSTHIGNLDENSYFNDTPKYYLDCQLYQRSCDVFLGVPYNTASYALLTHILSEICGFLVGDLIHTFGDVHIYENHKKQVDEQLSRQPKELPNLKFSDKKRCIELFNTNQISLNEMINNLEIDFFSLENYNPHPKIKAKLSTGLK